MKHITKLSATAAITFLFASCSSSQQTFGNTVLAVLALGIYTPTQTTVTT